MTQAFNLSQLANKVNSSGELDLATGVTGLLPVNEGGTGQTTYTNGQLLIGNSTGNTLTKSTLTAGTGITITNGTGSITIDAAAGQLQTQIFTAPGTWTKPASCTQVRVTVIGGGGGGAKYSGAGSQGGGPGGFGGMLTAIVPVSAPVAVTVGAGGANSAAPQSPGQVPGGTGGTSSFGPVASATGGAGGGYPNVAGANGTGTISSGTILRNASSQNSTIGITTGIVASPSPVATSQPFSITTSFGAGYNGVGAGTPGPITSPGVGGVVVVEFVG